MNLRMILAASVVLLGTPASFEVHAAPQPKVVICHIPPGNPNNRKEIQVNANAVGAHLGHGDLLGGCEIALPQ